jgi:hypothetical protein
LLENLAPEAVIADEATTPTIATRFDKLANTFLAGVLLVCVVL